MKLSMLFPLTLCCCCILTGSVAAQQPQQQNPSPPAPSPRGLVYLPPDSLGWKVTAQDTRGAYTFGESIVPPQTGPEPHRHSREDEAWYVFDGQLEIRVGEHVMKAAPGTFVFAPRGIPHNYKNVGTTPAKVLVILAPAGLEKFFEERETLRKELPTTDPAYPERYKALAEKYGLEYSSDWSFPSKEKE